MTTRIAMCSRPNCPNLLRAWGLCAAHYANAAANGRIHIGFVSSERSRAHVCWLLDEGVSLSEMTRVSGVPWQTLKYLRTHPRMLASTEHRILKVQPGLGQRIAAEAKVPSLGSARRLQALAAIGYDNVDLAERLGMASVTVWRVQSRVQQVEVRTARAVKAVFDGLWDKPGKSKKARTRARKYGWVSALAWDDIDDPAEVPNVGENIHITAQARIDELYELGVRNVHDIARRLGIKPKSVERQLYPSRYREAS